MLICIVAYIISNSDCTQRSKSRVERVLIFLGEEGLAFLNLILPPP
ncbi:hypothetical protein PL8927_40023 [Planktothrix serta PCC 8927]|uniref:Uncharacterized protein n=1 Tax=Planktothrix serta PCC 8927 TaxID=671068 RepID=A0A7Z9BN14_9CYAN|nr:hypothetical protein PL8927_40023 [Planktothrix serta PCC 8927]